MSKVFKTARGKMLDIDKIKLANENTVAVGNMRVNARGDLLGANNQIAVSRNQLMDQVYSVPESGYSPNDPSRLARNAALMEANRAKELAELTKNSIVSATDLPTPVEQQAPRGSLASSVAKQTTVTQEPISDSRKPKGPARI